ncbi:GNAT family N-acetyltransferase [Indiicoccus explosivorum]|uniref:GNAT family N-acetyltransferase n=1 Tax=Indiicoccus explosivorum TaxID=1917864 RepID=UPI000B4534A7|nr:GNAT family N-acetyltransferase [Indiicoccus explosivorum]
MLKIIKGDNKFSAMEGDQEIGQITFSPSGENHFVIDHTEVKKEAEGQGLGEQLVEKVVELAREENKTVDPQCPFAAHIIQKNEEFQDVLPK